MSDLHTTGRPVPGIHTGPVPDLGTECLTDQPLEVVQNSGWFCLTARELIGGDGQRRQDYGPAIESFERIAKMWSAILDTPVTAEQVAMCQAALKMARLFQTPNHTDSWVDIVGYAALGGEIASTPGRYV